jgi:hypothetical protein
MNELVAALDTVAAWPDNPVSEAEVSSHVQLCPLPVSLAVTTSIHRKGNIVPFREYFVFVSG